MVVNPRGSQHRKHVRSMNFMVALGAPSTKKNAAQVWGGAGRSLHVQTLAHRFTQLCSREKTYTHTHTLLRARGQKRPLRERPAASLLLLKPVSFPRVRRGDRTIFLGSGTRTCFSQKRSIQGVPVEEAQICLNTSFVQENWSPSFMHSAGVENTRRYFVSLTRDDRILPLWLFSRHAGAQEAISQRKVKRSAEKNTLLFV